MIRLASSNEKCEPAISYHKYENSTAEHVQALEMDRLSKLAMYSNFSVQINTDAFKKLRKFYKILRKENQQRNA